MPRPLDSPETPAQASALSDQLAMLQLPQQAIPHVSRSRRWLWLALPLGALVACAFLLSPLQVLSKKVKVATIGVISPTQAAAYLNATGYVVAERVSRVVPCVSGRVSTVVVREGDLVEAGKTLFTLDSRDQRNAMRIAEQREQMMTARAAAAHAAVAESEILLRRAERLAESAAGPAANVKDLQARFNVLTAQARAADAESSTLHAEVTVARASLDDATVTAPVRGIVLTKAMEVGELVGPSSTSLIEIADPDSLIVEVDVPELHVSHVRTDQPCEVNVEALADRSFQGKVTRISPRVNRAKGSVAVKVSLLKPDPKLLPDMSARVSFLAETPPVANVAPMRVVPGRAVVQRQGRTVVFVLDQGRVRQTPVAVGKAVGDNLELLEGPATGTRVVQEPPERLADGDAVSPDQDQVGGLDWNPKLDFTGPGATPPAVAPAADAAQKTEVKPKRPKRTGPHIPPLRP